MRHYFIKCYVTVDSLTSCVGFKQSCATQKTNCP